MSAKSPNTSVLSPAPLYLIDAYGLIYRSYFAFLSRPLRNSRGQNISALFGFVRLLVSLLDEGAPGMDGDGNPLDVPQKPRRLAAVFDSRGPTFRHKIYPEYKATRQKAPEDLHAQVPLVEETLKALGIPMLQADGYEADDIIAALARKCREENRQCYILSSDKDLLQLVGQGTYELRPLKSSGADAGAGGAGSGRGGTSGLPYELVDSAKVKAEWGVLPDKIPDLLSLIGDSSDNVPGVKGVGEKTAVPLMARYGSLDEIYRNIAGIEGALGKKLAAGKESAYFSRSLILLDHPVPLQIEDIDELSIENINRSAGARVLLREGIRQSARALDPLARLDGSGADNSGQGLPPGDTPKAGATGMDAAGMDAAGTDVIGAEAAGAVKPANVDPALLGVGTYKTILDFAELEALLDRARKQGFLALDFETDSLDAWNARPIGISLAVQPKEAFYVPVAPHRGKTEGDPSPAPFLDPGKVRELLLPFLADPDFTVLAHNAKYDYKVSRGWGVPRWSCKIWDTMVAAWVDTPERNNYSLDSLAVFYLSASPVSYNDIVPKGNTFDMVPLDTACRYSAEDADFTLRMMRYLEPKLKRAESLGLFLDLEMPLLPILAEMEGAGIKIAPKILKDYGQELFRELNTIQEQTYKLVGHEFNLASTKQLREVLFTERKLQPGKKTKTGYSTDVAVLEELAREDPVPALILRHRTLAKLKS
ncbi:MAG: DNA polymerase I, partial [Treponema sp.]|nr:DNA polymerase I [Treponema sp.]